MNTIGYGLENMNNNLVSIIMPAYNRGYTIGNAIQSVLGQTSPNWELIIVDDGSEDNTEDVVKAFSDSRIVYMKNEQNKGANYSRNRGCKAAKGRFLAFLDSDNIWKETMIKRQLNVLENSEDKVAFAFCKQEVIDKKVHIFPSVEFDVDNLGKTLRRGNVVDTNTAILKREVLEAVGGFDDHMPRMQDWELFFRIVVVYHYKAIFIPEILDTNVIQLNSISNDNHKYCKALNLFLRKHYNYFTSDEIGGHLISLGRSLIGENPAQIDKISWSEDRDSGFETLFAALSRQVYRQFKYYDVLLHWKESMEKSKGRTIFSKLALKDSSIALYGLGRWGELIYQEMKNNGIAIQFGIDRKVQQFHDIRIIGIREIPETVDVVLVSIFQEYDTISQEISRYFSGEILSIEDFVYEAMRNGEM